MRKNAKNKPLIETNLEKMTTFPKKVSKQANKNMIYIAPTSGKNHGAFVAGLVDGGKGIHIILHLVFLSFLQCDILHIEQVEHSDAQSLSPT